MIDEVPTEEERKLEALKEKVHRDRGFNCHFYKDKCLRRRLAVRMRARGIDGYEEYASLLDTDPSEYDVLLDTLTINVTKFFRNEETWAAIRDLVVPELFAFDADPVRIWSAGCSSGEEPYSISILLREWAEAHGREADVERFRIVATDIDRRSLDAAKRAEYADMSVADLADEVRERWFSPGPPYRLADPVRQNVVFLRKDLISGGRERGQHLIVCRNVIIYFDRQVQERIFEHFYEALAPGGFLVLGKVETLLGAARSLFRPVNNRERVFRKPT